MPFELGRPMGVPDNAVFQRKVLLDLISLLERTDGPFIIDDFQENTPETENEGEVLSCPVSFDDQDSSDPDPLKTRFVREIMAIRPWYDIAVKTRERTTVGGSGIEIDSLGEFLYAFVKGEIPENPRDDVDISVTLKLAVEDIKSYYVEGVTSQPGQEGLSSKALDNWFWNDTLAGKVLLELVRTCSGSDNEMIKMTGSHFIAPMEIVVEHGILGDKG